MKPKLLERMRTLYEKNDYVSILRLGRRFTVDEQISIPWYNGASFTIYSHGYLTRQGDMLVARRVFRQYIGPEYASLRRDMNMELIRRLDEMDAVSYETLLNKA